MKILRALLASTLVAANAVCGAGFTNLVSFVEETKIKGGFTEVNGQLYFACEKGGSNNFGYLGRFNPADGTLAPLWHFTTDAKPKGGLARLGKHLYFLAEKGSATTTWGWIGKFDPATGAVAEEFAYAADVKPKSGFAALGNSLYYATERGGAANQGMVEKFTPGVGVSTLASLTLGDGVKIESWARDAAANLIYFGAREGGDPAQLAGKGAGTIGRINAATGAVAKLADLHGETHGAKLRGLTFHAGKLWFALEEGGDLAHEAGKGGGALASCDPATGQITRHHVFDGATGLKPRALVAAGEDLYFATEKGGLGGLGVFGALRGGARLEVVGEFDATIGAKPDFAMTVVGNRVYFTPELGAGGFLGGISAYEFAAPALAVSRAGMKLRVAWPASAGGCVLQMSIALGSAAWQPVAAAPTFDGALQFIEIELSSPSGYFRLWKP